MDAGIRHRNGSSGNALVTVLIISAALLAVAGATMTFSRSDTMISQNTSQSVEALWVAQAGSEVAKRNLVALDHFALAAWIAAPTPTPYAGTVGNASYMTTIQPVPNSTPPMKFQIDSVATGPQLTEQRIREYVVTAQHPTQLDAISIHGDGSHTKVGDSSGQVVPNFTIDGRNHDLHGDPYNAVGQLPIGCPLTVSAVAANMTGSQIVQDEVNDLRCGLVKEADACCDASGGTTCSGGGRTCTRGLWWVRGTGASSQYTFDSNCNNASTQTFDTIDLSDLRLRYMGATYGTIDPSLDRSPAFLGPMSVDGAGETPDPTSFLRVLDTAGLAALKSQIEAILDFAVRAPASQKMCMPDLGGPGTTTTIGSWADPKIVVIPKSSHSDDKYMELKNQACGSAGGDATYDINNRRSVVGTGILVVPRAIVLDGGTSANPTRFQWRGIVLVLNDGDIRLGTGSNAQHVCGGVLGGVIMKDDTGNDSKLNLLSVGTHTCTNDFWVDASATEAAWSTTTAQYWHGFSVKYSCESINRGLSGAPGTIAWIQRFEGE